MDGQQMILKFSDDFDSSLMEEVLKIVENNELINISNEKNKLVLVSKNSNEEDDGFEDFGCFFIEFKTRQDLLKFCVEWKWIEFEDGQVDEENVLKEINEC